MPIFFYLLLNVIYYSLWIVITILFAELISQISYKNYDYAIRLLLFVTLIQFCNILIYLVISCLYNIIKKKIIQEIHIDLSQQVLKINSKSYNNKGTGQIVQRIINDPEIIVNLFDMLIGTISSLLISFIMVVYICFLNLIIGLAIFVTC